MALWLCESWGRGIEKVCAACIEDGIDLPVYDVHQDDVMVMLKTTEGRARGLADTPITASGGKVGGKVGGDIIARRQAVFDVIRQDPAASARQISDSTGISIRSVERAVKELKDMGLIERIGKARSGYWDVTVP